MARATKNLRPDDIEVDGLVAIATAHRPFGRGVRASLTTLQQRLSDPKLTEAERVAGLTALSSALLARHDYQGADSAARQAAQLRPELPSSWWQMAASFAGLGWFDEAQTCLVKAAGKHANIRTTSTGELPPLVSTQVGRAINRWAMSRTQAVWIGIIGILFMGLLGVALAITTPFLTREFRISRLDDDLRAMADEAWRSQHWTRVIAGSCVVAIVAVWITALVVSGPS